MTIHIVDLISKNIITSFNNMESNPFVAGDEVEIQVKILSNKYLKQFGNKEIVNKIVERNKTNFNQYNLKTFIIHQIKKFVTITDDDKENDITIECYITVDAN